MNEKCKDALIGRRRKILNLDIRKGKRDIFFVYIEIYD